MAKISTEKQTDNEVVYYNQPSKSKSKSKMIYEIIFLLVALGVLIFIGWASMTYGSSNNKPSTKTAPEENNLTVAESVPEENQSDVIILTAGQSNEYAELLTMNAGTEFEETQYVYYLPVGKYIAKNINEKYPAQINVYSGVAPDENGYDQYVGDFFVKLLQVGESTEVTVSENQFIEIHEPDVFELCKVDSE